MFARNLTKKTAKICLSLVGIHLHRYNGFLDADSIFDDCLGKETESNQKVVDLFQD